MKQSAYKNYHRTETLLAYTVTPPAGFDTTDHKILLNRLNKRYGIKETALNDLNHTYLTVLDLSLVNDRESTKKQLKYGVPCGSKLGPVQCTLKPSC
jgi:hypothetical protein